jgi:thiol-disulfide isomerase/thioredoxin
MEKSSSAPTRTSGALARPSKPTRPAIYDRTADGTRQIEEALKTTKAEKKNVLLQFGANWCGWCHHPQIICAVDGPDAGIPGAWRKQS